MRLGDLDALKEDFKSRLVLCNDWIEKAKDKETKIRASAVKTFIGDVIVTIDNAPTVEITEEQAIDKLHETGWLPLHDKEMTERPQGEWIFTDDDYGFWHCNQCKAIGSSHNNFCPNCGADMRGEEK